MSKKLSSRGNFAVGAARRWLDTWRIQFSDFFHRAGDDGKFSWNGRVLPDITRASGVAGIRTLLVPCRLGSVHQGYDADRTAFYTDDDVRFPSVLSGERGTKMLQPLYLHNPLGAVIEAVRATALGTPISWRPWGTALVVGLVVALLGHAFFRHSRENCRCVVSTVLKRCIAPTLVTRKRGETAMSDRRFCPESHQNLPNLRPSGRSHQAGADLWAQAVPSRIYRAQGCLFRYPQG